MNIERGAANNWLFLGQLVISFNQAGKLSQDRWERFIAEIGEHDVTHCLGTGLGAIEVNSVQRRQAAAALKGVKVAVVSDHVVSRGIVTALGWLGLDIRSYPWERLPEAAGFLSVPGVTIEDITAAARDLRDRSVIES